MAIDVSTARGRSLLLDALAQSDVDMDHHQLLNLNTENLIGLGTPPTIVPPANNWLKGWNSTTHVWTHQQVNFSNLAGQLTIGPNGQQRHITELGLISVGIWQGSVIDRTRIPFLDLIRPPMGPVNLGLQKIINLADPVDPGDAVNKRFMDFLLQGLQIKEAVRLATFAPTNLFGLPIVDGIQTVVGDRILVKNRQSEPHKIGIYVIGSDPSHTWTRSADMNQPNPPYNEFDRAYCAVREGTENAGTSWVQINHCENVDPDYPFEAKNFVLFSAASGEPGPPGTNGVGVPAGGLMHQVLRKIDGANYNTEWADPEGGGFGNNPPVYSALLTPATGNITGPTSAQGARMMGLAGVLMPMATGKVVATIGGFFWNDSTGGQVSARLVAGSGTPPVRLQIQPVGTSVAFGPAVAAFEGGAPAAVPFSVSGIIQNLVVGIPYWFDILLQANTTGTAFFSGVSISAYELP